MLPTSHILTALGTRLESRSDSSLISANHPGVRNLRETMTKTCQVTADSDPSQFWMTVEASSVFNAAIYYCGAWAARSGGPPVPTPDSIITVCVDGKEYRVCGNGPMREAVRDAVQQQAAGKKLRRA